MNARSIAGPCAHVTARERQFIPEGWTVNEGGTTEPLRPFEDGRLFVFLTHQGGDPLELETSFQTDRPEKHRPGNNAGYPARKTLT